ncbi:MAG: efflux RND transporter periplasmic adaptor subunit [Deltaproteobacteria bacterium]|nr:efflux RND transporter periplasmic adaptor subunit [Deltaproteobacteria bacterium]
MHNNYLIRLMAVVVFLIGGLVFTGCEKPQASTSQPQSPPAEVGVVVIQPQRVALTTELAGRTSAYLIAEVRPQVCGIIQKRLFTEGADVKSSEVLYQIDPASYQAAYSSAKAALSRAEASLTPARLKADRYKELVKINAVSQQDYDDSLAALKQTAADVEAGKAALETARINLAYTRVTSPITGRIGKSSVTVGALVTASQNAALSTVQQLDPIYVDVTQSSAEMLRLKRSLASGQFKSDGVREAKVKLILEDGTMYSLEGNLKFSDVTVDQSTGSITLRAVFPNPEQILLPGMYVRTVIEEAVNERAILVPQQGVTRNNRGIPSAMIVDASDKVELRNLEISRAIGDKWLVTNGLKAGDRLIVDGLQKIKPGAPVKVVSLDKTVPVSQAASTGAVN